MKHPASGFAARLALSSVILMAVAVARALPAPPVITSFNPVSGPTGSSITITGAHFSAIPGSNIVYFGGVKGIVTVAKTNSLTVKIPAAAAHASISVTAGSLTAYSRLRFVPTFVSDGVLNAASFGPRIDIPASWPGWFEAVAVADLDGDGKPELITTINHTEHSIWIRRNMSVPGTLSEASFAPPVTFDYGASGMSHGSLAVADLDGDGKLDLTVWNDAHERFAILRNTSEPGTISLEQIPYINQPSRYTQWITSADVDQDGKPDLLGPIAGGCAIWPNSSTGGNISFNPKVDFPSLVFHLAVADLDGDGKPDVVTPNTAGSEIWIARNTGVGPGINGTTLGSPVALSAGQFPFTTAIGDLDGDGKLDLVSNNRSDNTLSLIRNLAMPGSMTSNSFASQVVVPTSTDPFGLALGDLNGDGKLDIVTGHNGSSTISVFKNQTVLGTIDGNSFAPTLDLDAPTIHGVSVADLDGDGQPEIIGSRYDAGLIAIYPNKVSAPPSIVIQPSSVITAFGAAVTLTPAVIGWPLSYQWTFHGTNLVGATNASLTLTDIHFAQAGVYALSVSNHLGTATSSNAVVIVNNANPLLTAVNGAGSVTISPATNQYRVDETITIRAIPSRYYTFLRWSDGLLSNPRTATVTLSNAVAIAIFTNTLPLEELVFKQWDRSFGGTNRDGIFSVRQTSDGGFILGGRSNSDTNGNKTSINYGDDDFWVVRLDPDGNKLWERSYGGVAEDVLTGLRQTKDGGFILAGYSRSGNTGNKTSQNFGSADYWIVRLSANGDRIWDRSFGGGGADGASAVRQTADGGFIAGGMRAADDYWVVRLDADGDDLWDRAFGGPANDEAQSLEETHDGGFILGGYASSDISGNKSSPHYGNADFWAVRVDWLGNKVWDRSFGGGGFDNAKAVLQNADGGFLLSGYSRSGADGNKSSTNFGDYDFWTVRVDPAGDLLWDRAFGGSGDDQPQSSERMSDGGFILGGYSASGDGTRASAQWGGQDFWLVRLDANGRQRWDASFGGSDHDSINSLQRTSDGGFILGGYSQSPANGNKSSPHFGDSDFWVVRLALREAPVGTPAALVNGQYSPSNRFVFGNSNIVVAALQTTFTNGAIFYTLGNGPPTSNSLLYTGPFPLSSSASIRAIAYSSNRTQSAEMDEVTVTINNIAPTIAFNPATTGYLNPGSNALLSVTATDDLAVKCVEFSQGTILLRTVTNAPFEIVWTNPPPGRHTITARAYDAVGASNQATAAINVVAGTIVSGLVGGQTWVAQSGPYYVAGDVQVADLTIQGGVSVLFGGNYQFEVLGPLSVVGSNSAPVVFTSDTNVSAWGGLFFNAASGPLRMEYCIVERSMNSGLRIHNSSPILRRCTIRNNDGLRGAGIDTDSPLVLEFCDISSNAVSVLWGELPPEGFARGGGIYCGGATLTLIGCRVQNNSVDASFAADYFTVLGGGGVFSEGRCVILDCDISGNRLNVVGIHGVGGGGGGVFSQGRVECQRSVISRNETCANAGGRGGGVAAVTDAMLLNCVLQGNRQGAAEQSWGGGLFCGQNLWMTNCLVVENQATTCGPWGAWIHGGGIEANLGAIENCTIAFNTGENAIRFQGTVHNSILFFNSPGSQVGPGPTGTATVSFSNVQGDPSGLGNRAEDPLFAPGTNYFVSGNSPTIDAGDPDPSFDDGCFPPSLGTARNDLGAYGGPVACGWSEFGVARPTVVVNGQTSVSNAFVFGSSNVVLAEIQSPFSNGTTFYTLNGDSPTTNSPTYAGPIQLVSSAVIRAVAFNSNRTEIAVSYRTVVTINNNAPVVNLTTPTAGATFVRGDQVPLAANANDSDGPIQRVEFSTGGNLLAVSTNIPFSAVWSNVQGGNYTLTAIAFDNVGTRSTSSVNISVRVPVPIDVQGGGGVIRSPDRVFYAVGENLTLTATSARYYQFARWSSGQTNASINFIVGPTNSLTAIFTNAVPLEELLFEQGQRSWGGSGNDQLKVALPTQDGGLFLAGESSSPTNTQKTAPAYGQSDWWVIKLDLSGNERWQRSFGGSGVDTLQFARQTTDGGYLLGGYSTSGADGNKATAGFGGEDWWVVKINALGQIQWQQAFGIGPHHDNLMDGLETPDGGYLLAGSAYSNGNVGNKDHPGYGVFDFWLVKVNAFGVKQWEQTYGGAGEDLLLSIVAAADGGHLLVGQSSSPSGGNKTRPNLGDWDWWVLKVNVSGAKIWEEVYGGLGRDAPASAFLLPDGGYLLGGFSESGSQDTKAAPLYGLSDYWLVRLDGAGNKTWDRSYGGTLHESVWTLQPSRGGSHLVGGYSHSSANGNKLATNFGASDWWVLETDSSGTRRRELSWGGAGDDWLRSIARLNEGYLLAGSSQSGATGNKVTSNLGDWDWWTINIASREAPLGTPATLVNGRYSPSNHFVLHTTNLIEVRLLTTLTNASYPTGNIYYTLDGTEPDVGAEFYSGAFIVSDSVVIRAVAYDEFFSPPGALMDPVTITVLPLYTLVVSTPGGGSVSNAPLAALYPSNSLVTITATPQPGWSFMQWEGDATGANPLLTVSMDRPRQVQAVFGTLVTTTNTGQGRVIRQPPQGPYPYNSKVRLSALPDPGRFFSAWADATSGTISPIDFVVTNPNPRVVAVFGSLTGSRQSLTTLVNGEGGVTRDPQAAFYNNGATVLLTPNPAAGSFFAGWSGDASGGDNPLPVLMNASKVVTANFATTPVNLPPTAHLLTPSGGSTFAEPADITISATAADSDGSIGSVEFFEGTNRLAAVSVPPFTLAWTNVLAGSYVLTAHALDNGGQRGTSAPVQITVATVATNPPVFSFSSSLYEVDETIGNVTITVLKSAGSGPATVNFITLDDNARSGLGSSGDYAFASGSLTFTNVDTQKTILLTIHDDLLLEGRENFSVILSSPSHGGVLGQPSTATVRIRDNEIAATNSVIDRVFPTTPPAADGLLRITLEPPEAFGQWRFPWAPQWRDGGVLVPGLVAGNYQIQFKPAAGYEQPPNLVVPVAPNALTSITNYYLPTHTPRLGVLRVDLLPDSIAPLAQWHRQGETNWHASGQTISNLNAGVHIVEFRPVSGRVTPAARGVTVVADQENAISVTYLMAESPPGTPPSRLGFSTIVESPYFGLPYGYAGQISSALGFGSGFVVRERVVLTAAHVVFDDVNLSFVGEVFWFFQRQRGEYEPRPQNPRGWYVFSGYAAQRQADNTPGVSTPASQDQDVAALFFLEPAGRGGWGGYLMSEGAPNEWLTGSRQRLLVGYPVEMLPDANDAGKMHAAGPFTSGFTPVSNQVYATTQVKSYPGNSGGPLCVMYTNNVYYPAAIYLGGSNQTIVRAIDGRVVDLINRGEVSGNEGGNNTGGGVITIIPPLRGDPVIWGAVQIHLGPPSAVTLGGAWRVSPTNTAYSAYTNYTSQVRTIPVQSGTFTIEFRDLPGFNRPSNQFFQIITDQIVPIYPRYIVLPPHLQMGLQTGLSITGTPNTTYRIERTAQLLPPAWSSNNTVTLTPDPIRLPGTSPTNAPSRFYRAVWLP